MKRVVTLATVIVIASAVAARHSAALGGESLACLVDGAPGTFSSPECAARVPRSSYDVVFQVQGGDGAALHSWATNGGAVISGCTSTSSSCVVRVGARAFDKSVAALVTLTQDRQTIKIGATASIPAVCSLGGQLVFC